MNNLLNISIIVFGSLLLILGVITLYSELESLGIQGNYVIFAIPIIMLLCLILMVGRMVTVKYDFSNLKTDQDD